MSEVTYENQRLDCRNWNIIIIESHKPCVTVLWEWQISSVPGNLHASSPIHTSWKWTLLPKSILSSHHIHFQYQTVFPIERLSMMLLRWPNQQCFQQLLQQPAVYACMPEQSFHEYKGIAHEGAFQPAQPKMKGEKSHSLKKSCTLLEAKVPKTMKRNVYHSPQGMHL